MNELVNSFVLPLPYFRLLHFFLVPLSPNCCVLLFTVFPPPRALPQSHAAPGIYPV